MVAVADSAHEEFRSLKGFLQSLDSGALLDLPFLRREDSDGKDRRCRVGTTRRIDQVDRPALCSLYLVH
jgi:hypothetical protein